jgi:hypothetical protein
VERRSSKYGVPCPSFITQGVSPHRDVVYLLQIDRNVFGAVHSERYIRQRYIRLLGLGDTLPQTTSNLVHSNHNLNANYTKNARPRCCLLNRK